MFEVGYKPQTAHSLRERTDRYSTGLDQFILSQNAEFSAYMYILHIMIQSSIWILFDKNVP